ncbi:Fic family protein [Candidatus Micrarchaeota archaeon]|nr:Fic family protein [Candidatus Micrarchaeota archaeon]
MAFIRRRSRGSTHYYELVESIRENGRVRQNSLKYFPSKKEAVEYAKKNGIEFKFEADEWIEPSLAKELEEKLALLNSRRPLSPSVLQRLREKFEVDMTYHSNAIEGNRLSLRETWLVLRRGITIRGKSLVEHLEATNHKEALVLLEKMVDARKEITEMDVLNLHAAILDKIDPQNAGFYRHEQVFIEGSNVVLPKWREVPVLMKKVFSELNNKNRGVKAVYSAVKVHYDTVRVHPFIDGNGRLSRLLMNFRLMRAGFPPTILRKQERRAYYSALDKADENDFRPFATLIAKDVRQALDSYLDAIQ